MKTFIADTLSRSRGTFARALPCRLRPMIAKGRREGRAPAGTRVRMHKNAHGMDYRSRRSPGLPCADGFNGVLRALPGERCTLAPVASAALSMCAPGRAAASPRDLTPATGRQDHTTSPSADGEAFAPGPDVRTSDDQPGRCDNRRVVPASRVTRRVVRPCHRLAAPALPRPPHPGPHLVTIAKRPSGRAGMGVICHKSEIRKSDIFLRKGVDAVCRPFASGLSRHAGARRANPGIALQVRRLLQSVSEGREAQMRRCPLLLPPRTPSSS